MESLCQDATDFWIPPQVPVLQAESLDGLTFLKDFVARNTPCVVEGLLCDWKATERWTDERYLIDACGEHRFHVNVSPDGRADSVFQIDGEELFVKPAEVKMTMREFLQELDSPGKTAVHYLSFQNDNLRREFAGSLLQDVPKMLGIAEGVLNPVDACNIWIGDERAVSSMHLDHYENLYSVLRGEKVFHLLPPCFHPSMLGEQEFPTAHWKLGSDGSFEIVREESLMTPWIRNDLVDEPDRFPECLRECLLECRVRQGQTLFLPAMWLHRVSQTKKTIAVNFWHDMTFDHRWVYHNQIGRMSGPVFNDSPLPLKGSMIDRSSMSLTDEVVSSSWSCR